MSNTRSEVNLEASQKRRGGLDDELWRIDMLGQTGRDLENTDKRKIQQEDKPRLNNNGTWTEKRKEDKNGYRCEGVRLSGACGKSRNSGGDSNDGVDTDSENLQSGTAAKHIY